MTPLQEVQLAESLAEHLVRELCYRHDASISTLESSAIMLPHDMSRQIGCPLARARGLVEGWTTPVLALLRLQRAALTQAERAMRAQILETYKKEVGAQ